AACTASMALANSASTLSPAISTTRPRCRAMTSATRLRQVPSARTVPASSSLISRLKPATSALRIAVSLRLSAGVPTGQILPCSGESREAHRGAEIGEAQRDLRSRQRPRCARFGRRARHAFGEVAEDQQARPLVRVAPPGENAAKRQREGQRFQREERAAKPQRRKPQFPCERQDNER